uniref:C-type lectin domain-containing protein n=1 Tax=Steinernema glaseri TaxID=37863 RepID=A0A1I7YYD4_9BILA
MRPCLLFLLLAVLGFPALPTANPEQYRYTYIESKITGQRKDFKTESLEDCGFLAFNRHAFALSHFTNSSGQFCGVLTSFSAIEANANKTEHYFLRDRRDLPAHECNSVIESVRDIIEKARKCEGMSKICAALTSLEKQCAATKNENCTCPPGQKFNGEHCCPFITKPDGKEECCLGGNRIKHDEMGAQFCCPLKGACCPQETKAQRKVDEREVCCPEKFSFYQSFNKCLATFELERPENQTVVTDVCLEREALPVKIENAQQNNDLPEYSTIGLQIPENDTWGVENFRWVSDSSTPTYTNWKKEEPNNHKKDTLGDEVLVLRDKDGSWYDFHPKTDTFPLPMKVVCMTEAAEAHQVELDNLEG